MSEALFPYYERELLFVRQLAQEFAGRYPAAAGRLLLEPNRSQDPHVERLIESFALLAGRIHHKIDDEFPELTEALLSVLYPHYLVPIPSLAIEQFELDPARSELPKGFRIEKGARLKSRPINGLPCRYRTCYPVTLWPIALTAAKLSPPPFPVGLKIPPKTAAVLRLQLECVGPLQFANLAVDRLRFYLFGDNQLIPHLYEMLFNNVSQVVFRSLDKGVEPTPIVLKPEEALAQVGFDTSEGLLPYPQRSFLGYRLLTEYFAFPNKFQFVDLCGLQKVCQAKYQKKMEVLFFLNRTMTNLEQSIEASTFRLGCTPIINLFDMTAEPIELTHARYEYKITPEVAHGDGMEIYSVDGVAGVDPTKSQTTEYEPFYAFRHGKSRDSQRAFWYATRQPSLKEGDRGTDILLHLVDLDFHPRLPAEEVLVVRTTCTNRDLPAILQRAGEDVYFELEAAAPLKTMRCLRTPTLPLRPPARRGQYWRLLSHLNLNHLSLTDPVEGRDALQEILKLYDFSDPASGQQLAAVNRQIIEGILEVSSRRAVGRTGVETAGGFCRGLEVTIEFDETKYQGTGLFAFASVLERFLGLYASINSFSQLVAKVKQGEGVLKKWPPRTAERVLL